MNRFWNLFIDYDLKKDRDFEHTWSENSVMRRNYIIDQSINGVHDHIIQQLMVRAIRRSSQSAWLGEQCITPQGHQLCYVLHRIGVKPKV